MVLEGNFGCLQEDDFIIIIVNDDNFVNGNIFDGYGQWIYEIIGLDVIGFELCWGFIIGEDKMVFVIICLFNNLVDFLIIVFDILYGGNVGSLV